MNLQLPLKTNWFNMTKSGEKTEDYRELTNYWFKRLFDLYVIDGETGKKKEHTYNLLAMNSDTIMKYHKSKPFKNNIMTLGYPKASDADRILKLEHKGIEIREGNPEWGAKAGVKYFVIKHGRIV